MVAANMDLAETVLHHARGAQQHLVQRRILAQRRVADRRLAEVVARGAEAGLDLGALAVEALADHLDGEGARWIRGGRRRGPGLRFDGRLSRGSGRL